MVTSKVIHIVSVSSSRIFIIFNFACGSIIYFELVLLRTVRPITIFTSLPMIVPAPFVVRLFHYWILVLCQTSFNYCYWWMDLFLSILLCALALSLWDKHPSWYQYRILSPRVSLFLLVFFRVYFFLIYFPSLLWFIADIWLEASSLL